MDVRLLQAHDLVAALAINNASTPAVTEATEVRFAHIFQAAAVSLGTFDGEVLVGFSLALEPLADYDSSNYCWFGERYDNFVYLDRIAIAASHQNRGLGSLLYEELERHICTPVLACEVNLRPPNEGSLRFHERIGFREVGQQETPYGSLVSMLVKDIAAGVPKA